MAHPIKCLVCGRTCNGVFDPVDRRECSKLRERGWQISADHTEAVCPGCIRDVMEDIEESPASTGFLTWDQIQALPRVMADGHTHEPESEFGDVPGVVRHLASTLKTLDPQEVVRPITQLQKLAADAGPKRVEVVCQCDEEAPNHHGGYGECPKHGDFGDHLLAGDSIGGHQWQGASADFCLIDEAVDKPSIDEPASFQDADDDTWHRMPDGSYRIDRPNADYHQQPSLEEAVFYAGLAAGEGDVLDALQQNTSGELARRNAELLKDSLEMARRIEEQDDELDRLSEAEQRSSSRADEAEHQNLRHREVEHNQSVALDEYRERTRMLQDEIARVVSERNDLQKAVQSKQDQQHEVRKMYEGALKRIGFLERELQDITAQHVPVDEDETDTECVECGKTWECETYELALSALTECGRPHPHYGFLKYCVRDKHHLGLHRDTDERINSTCEWDNDDNLM